jgi:uridine kinase
MRGMSMTDAGVYDGLFKEIERLAGERGRIIAAIDGNSAAGKSSLASLLSGRFSCGVIHMDDFFLRPEQRTAERLAEPGGNIDYERFEGEVLSRLREGVEFEYRPFCCGTRTLLEPVRFAPGDITVIEGVYSLHPLFSGAYDIKVFLSIDAEEQLRRLEERSPGLLERFKDEWLPVERVYFDTFKIAGMCDLTF